MDGSGDRLQPAAALLFEQEREEIGLEEEIPELVLELGAVCGDRRIGDLIRLFDRMRNDRSRRLLPVPGAIAPQALGQALELEERVREGGRISRWLRCRSRRA
jgi:hypothetical protein